jgi:hypothetical protein
MLYREQRLEISLLGVKRLCPEYLPKSANGPLRACMFAGRITKHRATGGQI